LNGDVTLFLFWFHLLELLSGAVKSANESKTSLKAAREILDSSLQIYKSACESSADKFELCTESTKALAEHEKIERERLEVLIKRKNLEESNAKREQGLETIGQLNHLLLVFVRLSE